MSYPFLPEYAVPFNRDVSINVNSPHFPDDDYDYNTYIEDKYAVIPCVIPIDKLKYSIWDIDRYQKSYKLISELHTCLPILAEYDYSDNILQLADGNHRIAVCKDIGYSHIPTILHIYL